MIYGIGTDIVEIDRMRDAVERWGNRLLKRIFTEQEIAYCYRGRDPFPHLAARFAAKEALIKALTSENNVSEMKEIRLTDMEILNQLTGRPVLCARGHLKSYFDAMHLTAYLSLAHERNYAAATVVLERQKE